MTRLRNLLWWLAPVLVLLWIYRDSFQIWFREDDFPLLGFVRTVHDFPSFLHVLFIPYAQGTIRPWSERLPFLLSETLFGLDCVPYRIAVFVTAAADMCLLTWVVRRLTGSRVAGLAAAVFWAASASIVSPMTWNSSYNEVQHPLFLLGALALFIRYAESGKARWWWLQFAVFVLGFGSLETNIVYPAIAVAWALFAGQPESRRRLLIGTAPLFAVSLVYFLIHQHFVPPPKDAFYVVHVDGRILRTFWEYWRWAFLPPGWKQLGHSFLGGLFILVVSMTALIAFTVCQLRARRFGVLFCLSWFLCTIGPMLVLPDRHTEYYLSIPVMGLAMLAGWGVGKGWAAGWLWRAAALVPAAMWLIGMVPVARAATRIYVGESKMSRALVLGVQAAREAHPGKAIVLEGMTDAEYRVTISQGGFHEAGVDDVYLTPGTEAAVHSFPDDDEFLPMVLDPTVALHALGQNEAVVYAPAGDHLRNITRAYATKSGFLTTGTSPRRVEVGKLLYGYLLGPGWMAPQSGIRWMPGLASLTIGGPTSAGEHLTFSGYCTDQQLKQGPLYVSVAADGVALGVAKIVDPELHFHRDFAIPDALVGKPAMEISIRVNPVERVGNQDYGALFGEIALSH